MLGEAKDWQAGVESPIEDRMFIAVCDVAGWMVHRRDRMSFFGAMGFAESRLQRRHVLIVPQCKIDRFRVDIGVFGRAASGRIHPVLIECDGKDFHAGPNQKARDQRRDAEISRRTSGCVVKRYTGSAIRRSALECARDALAELIDAQKFSAMDEPTEAVDRGEWWDLEEGASNE